MKVVILAGGLGTRISEESQYKPKPMVEVGGMPILWHIMKEFSHYGLNEFIVCAGYKQEYIKKWFSDYFLYTSDITFNFDTNQTIVHNKKVEPWKVTIVNTGLNTDTAGRLKRIQSYIGDEPFIVTYGDGVGNVNISELIDFHKAHPSTATITTYRYSQNKGVVNINNDGLVESFREKSTLDDSLINIGYMILEPSFFELNINDSTSLEKGPILELTNRGDVYTYTHKGFWQCVDTLREKQILEKLWTEGNAPWKLWED